MVNCKGVGRDRDGGEGVPGTGIGNGDYIREGDNIDSPYLMLLLFDCRGFDLDKYADCGLWIVDRCWGETLLGGSAVVRATVLDYSCIQ